MTTTATETHPIAALRSAAITARRWIRAEERRVEAAMDELMASDDDLTPAQDRELMRLEDRMQQLADVLETLIEMRRQTRGLA